MKAVVAACDIKSNALNAEIGYWSSQAHRGVMTNALVAMCDMAAGAGFVALFARTKTGNVRSEAVLKRAGFQRSHGRTDDRECFIRTLKAEEPNKSPEPTTMAVTPRATPRIPK